MPIILNKKETLAYIKKATNVRSKLACNENDFKMNVEGKKMPTIENEPSLTDIMNELKSFKKETNARFVELEKQTNVRFDSIDKNLKLIKSLPTIAKELSEL
ncbi:MAG: hypothetical protein RSG48_06785, partial [Clostridia bacterium]